MEEVLKRILSELELVRKLQMIGLMEKGYSQSKLGAALGISQASISRMLAGRKSTSARSGAKIDEHE